MEETKYLKQEYLQDEEEKSSFDIKQIYTILVLNWKWFVLSIIICLGVAYIYLRYTTPIYQAQAKLLIKDETQSRNRGNSIMNTSNLGIISNSTGIDNEMEILSSCNLAQQAVTDLKLYVTYRHPGHIKDATLYRNQEINVDMDLVHLKKLCAPIQLNITREGNNYHVTGTYYMPVGENTQEVTSKNINRTFNRLPAMIGTRVGIITLTQNEYRTLADGQVLEVTLSSPVWAAGKYAGSLTVSQTSKTTTIAQLVLSDEFPQRAIDYLKQLAIVYNRQANEDKNLIAVRTEQFINNRLEKINAELGNTEGELENFSKRLTEANTQLALLDELNKYMNEPNNNHQPIPSNVGLSDESATALINEYNRIALQRNQLLHSANETSPTVTPLTAQLDDLTRSEVWTLPDVAAEA